MFNFIYRDIDFAHKLDLVPKKMSDYSKHAHHFNEVLFFVGGDVNYTVENLTHKLEPGDVVIIPSGKFHFLTFNSESSYERYVFKFPDSILPPQLLVKFKKMPLFISTNRNNVEYLKNFDTYANEKDRDDAYLLCICELIKTLIITASNTTTCQASKTEANDFIQEIITYIDKNIYNEITLEDLSQNLNFSKSHLCNQFKKYMKISLIEYVRHKKIFVAESLIKSGMKKSVVAQELGFKDYSTFYRQYKKITKEKAREQESKEE